MLEEVMNLIYGWAQVLTPVIGIFARLEEVKRLGRNLVLLACPSVLK